MPVFIMKQVLPYKEFIGWVNYIRNKPPSIQEYQMAVLTTVAANAMGGKSKHTDFLVSKMPKQTKAVEKAAPTAFDSFFMASEEFKGTG